MSTIVAKQNQNSEDEIDLIWFGFKLANAFLRNNYVNSIFFNEKWSNNRFMKVFAKTDVSIPICLIISYYFYC